jgi:hypothetical protein
MFNSQFRVLHTIEFVVLENTELACEMKFSPEALKKTTKNFFPG